MEVRKGIKKSAKGARCRQLSSEGRRQEDRAVWSLCRLGAALISPAGDDTPCSRKKECDRSCGVPVFQRRDALNLHKVTKSPPLKKKKNLQNKNLNPFCQLI